MYGRNIEIHVDIFHVYCFAIFQVYYFSLREATVTVSSQHQGGQSRNPISEELLFERTNTNKTV